MAGLTFAQLYGDAETLGNVPNQRAFVKRLVNNGVAHLCSRWDWPWLWDEDFVTTVAEYTTGTVAVTAGSTTLTGTSTVWTSAMVGRKVRVASQNAYYEIGAFVSTTELTLRQPYQGSTLSAQTYAIYKDVFRLRGDVDKIKLLRQAENGVALISTHVSDFDAEVPMPTGKGPADYDIFVGRDVATYETGTVSMTTASRTLTGASTAWTGVAAEGVSRGTKMRVGSVVFTVNTVDSGTQITTYEAATATIAAGTAYAAMLDNALVQLYTIPNTQENYYYRFQRLPAPLDRDTDFPDLPHPLHPLILRYVAPFLQEHHGQYERAVVAKRFFEDELKQAILRYGHMSLDRLWRRKPTDINSGGPRFASFPSGYGRPISW